MPLVILHQLLNVFVQLANKKGFTKKSSTSRIQDQSNALRLTCLVSVLILVLVTTVNNDDLKITENAML
jgi:uncharacterized membrane protein